jgi:hypothetical protein
VAVLVLLAPGARRLLHEDAAGRDLARRWAASLRSLRPHAAEPTTPRRCCQVSPRRF